MADTVSATDPFARMKITDLPYNPQYDPATFEAAKKWLESHRKTASGNATYVKLWDGVDGQPGATREYLAQACHANIAACEPGVSLIASVIKDPVVGGEKFRHRWYEWLYNESPYRHFILSDLSFAEKGGIILSSDMPAPLLQNILILSRHGWEVSKALYDLWVSCIDNGIPGWLAYATLINSKHAHAGYGGNAPLPWNIDEYYAPHIAQHRAHWLMNFRTLTNFRHENVGLRPLSGVAQNFNRLIKRQLTEPKQSYRYNTNFYGGVMLFDDTPCDVSSENYVMELLRNEGFKEAMRGRRQAVRQSVPDPFLNKNIIPPGGLTYKDIVEVAMPFVLEHGLTDVSTSSSTNTKETADAADKAGADGAVPAGAIGVGVPQGAFAQAAAA